MSYMCAHATSGPRYLDPPEPCPYESVPGFDFCDEHLRDERDWDETLKRIKEDRL